MKFLVIDDSVTMRRILINALQTMGVRDVVEAGDGRQALEQFDQSIGFVITDWNMPVLNGIEFTRQLRARSDGRSVPVLMVTTRSSRDDIVAAVEAGVNNYILKPFTPQLLKEKIDSLLAPAAAA